MDGQTDRQTEFSSQYRVCISVCIICSVVIIGSPLFPSASKVVKLPQAVCCKIWFWSACVHVPVCPLLKVYVYVHKLLITDGQTSTRTHANQNKMPSAANGQHNKSNGFPVCNRVVKQDHIEQRWLSFIRYYTLAYKPLSHSSSSRTCRAGADTWLILLTKVWHSLSATCWPTSHAIFFQGSHCILVLKFKDFQGP